MVCSGAMADSNGVAMALWSLQIALNGLWTPVFFGLQRIKAGMVVIVFLWIAVFGAMVTAWQLDPIAGAMLAPYLLWVTIAASLNGAVWRLNPEAASARPVES